MLTEEFAQQFAEEWLAAWNSHDLNRILSHYSDDFEFASPLIAKMVDGSGCVLVGKQAVGEYWQRALATYPDLYFQLTEVLAGASSLVIVYKSVGDLEAAEWFEFDDAGQVTRSGAHYAKLP